MFSRNMAAYVLPQLTYLGRCSIRTIVGRKRPFTSLLQRNMIVGFLHFSIGLTAIRKGGEVKIFGFSVRQQGLG